MTLSQESAGSERRSPALWWAWRLTRRLLIVLAGSLVLLGGVVLLFTPGPAVVVIPLGLAILSCECAWAARLLRRSRRPLRGQKNGRSRAWRLRFGRQDKAA